MNEPIISVIIPVYKVEKYLEECVKSVINQTYKNLEIILVDDGSPDSCPILCDEWAKRDSRIVVIHKENGGLSSARNAGVAIAKGEYIGFVDSDDFVALDMYEKMYNAILKSNAELCICGMKWINEDGSVYEKISPSPIIDEVLTKEEAFYKLFGLSYSYYVTSVNRLYKKNIFEKVVFPAGKLYEDEFTAHHFFEECESIVCIKDELYFYVQHQGSITHSAYTIKKMEAVDSSYDRYMFFKEKKDKEKMKLSARQIYGNLLRNIKEADVLEFKGIFRKWVHVCIKLLFPDIRIGKLLFFYIKRILKCL